MSVQLSTLSPSHPAVEVVLLSYYTPAPIVFLYPSSAPAAVPTVDPSGWNYRGGRQGEGAHYIALPALSS